MVCLGNCLNIPLYILKRLASDSVIPQISVSTKWVETNKLYALEETHMEPAKKKLLVF